MNRTNAETVTIVLPMPPKYLSPNYAPASAGGRKGQWRERKKQREAARKAIEECGVETGPWEYSSVTAVFYHKIERVRDIANYWGSMKGAIDGVKDAELIMDDDAKHLHYGGARFAIDRVSPPRVELTFTRLSPAPSRP